MNWIKLVNKEDSQKEKKVWLAEKQCPWASLTPRLGSYLFPVHNRHLINTWEEIQLLTSPYNMTWLHLNKPDCEWSHWSLPSCLQNNIAQLPCHRHLAIDQFFPLPTLLRQLLCTQPWENTNRKQSSSEVWVLESERAEFESGSVNYQLGKWYPLSLSQFSHLYTCNNIDRGVCVWWNCGEDSLTLLVQNG